MRSGRADPNNRNGDVQTHTGNITTNPISSALQRDGLADGPTRDFGGASVALEKSREFASQILQLVEVGHARRTRAPAQHNTLSCEDAFFLLKTFVLTHAGACVHARIRIGSRRAI